MSKLLGLRYCLLIIRFKVLFSNIVFICYITLCLWMLWKNMSVNSFGSLYTNEVNQYLTLLQLQKLQKMCRTQFRMTSSFSICFCKPSFKTTISTTIFFYQYQLYILKYSLLQNQLLFFILFDIFCICQSIHCLTQTHNHDYNEKIH